MIDKMQRNRRVSHNVT
jgi:hypothetical protein